MLSMTNQNDSFSDKIKQLQYKACPAIRGPHGKVFTMNLDLKVLVAEGGVETFVLYKLLSTQCPKYLSDIAPYSESFYDTRKKQTFF